MAHGYQEIRRVRYEPGPDGKPVPHVYVEQRELTREEAERIHADLFGQFESMFQAFDSPSSFKQAMNRMKSFFERIRKGR
jgi:hypothetical protein